MAKLSPFSFYRVNIRPRNTHTFATLERATDYCNKYFSRTGIVLSIVKDPELPGCEPDIAGLLKMKASAPIKPSKPQIACDHGLFSDEADQLDLCEMFMDE